jgi:epoxyqueuosine reductase
MSLSPNPHQLAAEIKRRAHDLGFDLVGIANASPSKYRDYYRKWLDDGQAGTMEYLARRFEERTDVATYMPGAKSVICVAVNYHVPLESQSNSRQGRIARYALGDDYHEHIKTRLHALADWFRSIAPDALTRCGVDTAPIMEKELAARAGIGWMGKNTCIINPTIGSWLLLGEIITNLELPPDDPAADRCGSCRRCIDACPTQAITGEYQLDARKCISYLTIEHRDDIAADLQAKIGDWLYGCDICQDVCPWNNKAPAAIADMLQPRFESGSLDVDEVASWSDDDYREKLRGSAMKRVKLPVLQRNARIVAANVETFRAGPTSERQEKTDDAMRATTGDPAPAQLNRARPDDQIR